MLVRFEAEFGFHIGVSKNFRHGNLQVRLHLSLVLLQGGVDFGLGVVNHDGSRNSGLLDLGLHVDDDVLLGLLNCDAVLDGNVGGC